MGMVVIGGSRAAIVAWVIANPEAAAALLPGPFLGSLYGAIRTVLREEVQEVVGVVPSATLLASAERAVAVLGRRLDELGLRVDAEATEARRAPRVIEEIRREFKAPLN